MLSTRYLNSFRNPCVYVDFIWIFIQIYTLFGTLNACFSNEIDFLKMATMDRVSNSKSLTICCNDGISIQAGCSLFHFLFCIVFSSFFLERKSNLQLFHWFSIFGIGTGWSPCHLVKKKCDTVPTA